MKPIVLAVVSDVHCGSTLAPCPPEGVRLDDGGTYHPSKVQQWLWECWEDYWGKVGALRDKHKADLWFVSNGDAVEGDHHGTSQIISRNLEAQNYVRDRVYGVPLALHPKRVFIVRGTEAHVGPSGNQEEALARHMKAEKDPDSGTWSWWHLRLKAHDVLLDFKHHGRTGGRPWTRASALGILASEILQECAEYGAQYPDVAVRAHKHVRGDSYNNHPVRVIAQPAWQIKTGHGHKVVAESLAALGGLSILVETPNRVSVEEYLYRPQLPRIM